jgi:hypothetical protein
MLKPVRQAPVWYARRGGNKDICSKWVINTEKS